MSYKIDIDNNNFSVTEFFQEEIDKAVSGYRSFCCDLLAENIKGFLESETLPRGTQTRADQVSDLMAYTLCHTILDCTTEQDLLFNLELLSIYKPTHQEAVELLLYIPVQYLSILNSLPPKQHYLNNIEQIKAKQRPLFYHYNSELQGGLSYLIKSLTQK